mmetsp:Transcript_233/g.529  ORF Transcript_233/g.529 Transcript_233/m.529 type:complete len:212 (-) Transcript_233:594-1229(-)
MLKLSSVLESRVWMAVVIAAVAAIVPAPPKPMGTSLRTSTADATLPSSSSDGLKDASSPIYSRGGDDDSSQFFTTVWQIVWSGRTTLANPAAKLLPLSSADDGFGGKILLIVWPASCFSKSFKRPPFSNPIAKRMRKHSSSFSVAALAAGKNGTYGPRLATQNRKFASPPSSGLPSLELSMTVCAATFARLVSLACNCTEQENRPDGRLTM